MKRVKPLAMGISKVRIETLGINYGYERLKEFWHKHRELKREAFYLLSEYFKWTYNYNEKAFDEIFLEDFNLKACNLCY